MLALLLADGRFPSGGTGYSGGVEAAVTDGRVTDLESLRGFLSGRLATAGRVAAGLAAAAARGDVPVERLDREAAARIASPALRRASRQQGRLLLRAALATGLLVEPADLHHPVAMGVVASAAGLVPVDAARWAAYDSVTGPASAAVRLLGLDPFATWGVVAALAVTLEEVAAEAAAAAPGRLPCCSAPLLDIGAERHAAQEVRLFAS